MILLFLLECIYLLLPAMFANMAPVFVKKLNFLAVPVDFNREIANEPIFGKNKTIRGVVAGIIAGIIITFAQNLLSRYAFFQSISLLDYNNFLIIGFLLGFGAMFGDLLESFIKRRLKIKPGASFFPFDQIDASIGAIMFLLIIYIPTWETIIVSITIFLILNMAIRTIGFILKVNEERW